MKKKKMEFKIPSFFIICYIEVAIEKNGGIVNGEVASLVDNMEYSWKQDESSLCFMVNHKSKILFTSSSLIPAISKFSLTIFPSFMMFTGTQDSSISSFWWIIWNILGSKMKAVYVLWSTINPLKHLE